MSRKALGRGLSALFTQPSSFEQDLIDLSLDLLEPALFQPRQVFKPEKLEELANSIKANGIIQPIVVRRTGDRFQIIAGERRWRAAQLAGLVKVPCLVKDIPEGNVLELSLIENLQREDLNPIEEALAYKRLIENLHLTQEEVARRIGKDRSSVTNSLRLLKLPVEIQKMVEDEKLTMGHARALLSLNSTERQRNLAIQIIAKGMSVRQTERAVQKSNIPAEPPHTGKPQNLHSTENPNILAAESKLKRRLGAPVKIKMMQQGGLIEIRFSSGEDLSRIFDLLLNRGDN